MNEYLKSAFYVLSSRFEGMPLVLLEAMEAGLPIVSFDCPCGPRDLLEPSFGKIVKLYDTKQLASAILECAKDLSWRQNASIHASNASKSYLKDNVMQMWNNLFCDTGA